MNYTRKTDAAWIGKQYKTIQKRINLSKEVYFSTIIVYVLCEYSEIKLSRDKVFGLDPVKRGKVYHKKTGDIQEESNYFCSVQLHYAPNRGVFIHTERYQCSRSWI